MALQSRLWKNNISIWTFTAKGFIYPAILASIWLNTSIGWLWSGAIVLGALLWFNMLQSMQLGKPQNDRWYARATFGKRIWLNQMAVPIPQNHNKIAMVLTVITASAMVASFVTAGLNLPFMTAGAFVATTAGHICFQIRMMKIYGAMRNAHPLYKSWSRSPANDNSFSSTRKARPADKKKAS